MSRLATIRPRESERAKGKCPVCHRPVYRGGLRHAGRFWHESCFRKSSKSRGTVWQIRN